MARTQGGDGREVYDIAVIGAGVTGAAIARRLSAYRVSVVLLEKECDVSFGVSKANSGIIHGGFHYAAATTLKGRLEVLGNLMFDRLHKELHFPFRRCGILVVAFSVEEMRAAEELYRRGVENQVIGIELAGRERMLFLEPKLNPDVVGGLYAPGGGVVEPYRFVFSLIESAQANGVQLRTSFRVAEARPETGAAARAGGPRWTLISHTGERVRVRTAINAAGLYADEVSGLFGAESFRIVPRKGEEFLLDRNASGLPDKVVFPVPSAHSKGILVIPTVEGTCMVGPTADEQEDKEDLTTTRENFERIFAVARRLVPTISERDIINSFAGLRPALEGQDFLIAVSAKVPGLVQVAGIQSPGLTAAPAIADYVKDLVKKTGLTLEEKVDWEPTLPAVPRIRELSPFEADALVRENPAYGEIVCRCESVSEAEIVAAIRRGHTTMDGIKFYTRAQMGRCQGGFCTYKILKILQRETGMSLDQVTKRGGASRLLLGHVGDRRREEAQP
ncbi:MAG: NAD(P)/FAD-dependent oxidoreductase [Spirochaetales bacterium]|nr:NAD(P)/FAD-dependent oxidoreductase [Spirochaetales bacterium]